MTTKEAIQAMLDGKKVREIDWDKDFYILFNGGMFVDEEGKLFSEFTLYSSGWEIYEEQKPVQTETIEKWLYKYEKTKFIVEVVNIDEYIKEFSGEKVKLLETYEVEI